MQESGCLPDSTANRSGDTIAPICGLVSSVAEAMSGKSPRSAGQSGGGDFALVLKDVERRTSYAMLARGDGDLAERQAALFES